jgi:P27 family predicted phage terminase small subunit
MGRRGPAPQTKELLRARGSRRANLITHDTRPSDPEAARPPSCPKWLDPDAKRMWRWVVPHLDTLKYVIVIDRGILARYCQAWSRWKRAEEFLQKYGETYPIKDSAGKVRCFCPWPQVAIAHQLGLLLLRLEQELGLSPASRTRINPAPRRPWQLPPPRTDGRFDLFHGGGRMTPPTGKKSR